MWISHGRADLKRKCHCRVLLCENQRRPTYVLYHPGEWSGESVLLGSRLGINNIGESALEIEKHTKFARDGAPRQTQWRGNLDGSLVESCPFGRLVYRAPWHYGPNPPKDAAHRSLKAAGAKLRRL